MTNSRSISLALALLPLLAASTLAQSSAPTGTRGLPPVPSAGTPRETPEEAPAGEGPASPFTIVELPVQGNALYGMSFADIDRDGDADLYNNNTGRTWENRETAEGREWVHLSTQDLLRPPVSIPIQLHYAASLADFNKDGLPDIATAPHTDTDALEVYFNTSGDAMGGVLWTQMPYPDVPLMSQDLERSFETHCWGDMDGDGVLDLFAPAYSRPNITLSGNLFWSGQEGTPWQFLENTSFGFSNPAQCDCFIGLVMCSTSPCRDCRPEGAQMFDLDDDGDLDIFCNGTTYLNVSTPGAPLATQLLDSSTGIGFTQQLDEGAVFTDVDMDGDFDLVINYASACETTPGAAVVTTMYLWTNRGDGTFYDAGGTSYFVDPLLMPNAEAFKARRNGLALADWDGDGDHDLIGRGIFRVNRLVDQGVLQFQEATIPVGLPEDRDALAAFADWDHDGDLDTAVATWAQNGYFFENTTFDGETDVATRPYLRIRPLLEDDDVEAGLETEFGAVVEVRVVNSDLPFRRRQFVSSSAGYLNQHEYALTFGLNDPNLPADPKVEIIVDFPSVAGQPRVRVDSLVNEQLGALAPQSATTDEQRHIDVFRNGDVRIGGTLYAANSVESRERHMAGASLKSGLTLQSLNADAPLGPLTPTDMSIGIDFDTVGGEDDLWISELIIDGKLSDAFDVCALGEGNIALWDVTNPVAPSLVPGGWLKAETPAGNHRTSFAVRLQIQKDRSYRLVAKMAEYRATDVQPSDGKLVAGLRARGGLLLNNLDPCDGGKVASAPLNPDAAYLSFRYGK